MGPGRFPIFLILFIVDRTPWSGDQPSQGLSTDAQHNTNRINTQTYKPRVGFEHVAPVFEGAKTVIP
jgi:hypothetical protein